jgi:hypothetical protein
MKTFALGFAGTTHIHAWCFETGRTTYGSVTFDVINGAWSGELTEGGVMTCSSFEATPQQAVVRWAGEVPLTISTKYGRDYNEAITWIQTQVDADPAGEHAKAMSALFGHGSS